jgi:hypothetical protein
MKKILVFLVIIAVFAITLYWPRSKPELETSAVPTQAENVNSANLRGQTAPNALSRAGPDDIYPRLDLNPGWPNPDINQANIADTICNQNWKTSSIRPASSYTTRLKRSQIVEYGFADTSTTDYEEDHIISLENGGDPRDPRNLYPEAYNTEVNGRRVGAHEKDAVENYVHNGICREIPDAKFSSGPKPPHSLSLEQGQQILARDWYACYQHLNAGEDCVP